MTAERASVSAALDSLVRRAIAAQGGWMPFDRFMSTVLYAPGLGYYARSAGQIGALPRDGSDFVTAPELSPLFGRALAVQLRQALDACEANEIWEFGAGTGALALQLLQALGDRVARYHVIEVSGPLRVRQQTTLVAHAHKLQWHDAWPDALHGVVIGNEVLDAMPVKLLRRDASADAWAERGVVVRDGALAFEDRPSDAAPPHPGPGPFPEGMVTEIHPQAQAFIASLAERMTRGAAFFIDYGFPAAEYYHPQRQGGTLMCHEGHRADADPLQRLGLKDITAHVDFTGIALAAQEAGLDVLGYTSQARFLLNCGIAALLEAASPRERVDALKLIHEHEMGELFKVIGFGRGCDPALAADAVGFAEGDRTHTL